MSHRRFYQNELHRHQRQPDDLAIVAYCRNWRVELMEGAALGLLIVGLYAVCSWLNGWW